MTKIAKILAPVVALGILIGAFIGVSASATEAVASAEAPEIISMNLEYGAELYLYYAVDKGTAEGTPKLEVLADAEGSEVLYTVTSYEENTVHGASCYIFKTKGVAPKDLNAKQYIRAVVGDVAGEIRSASVEDYLNTRLYKNGFAAKTEADGPDYTRRNLYYQLLEYGASAQELLYYGKPYEKIGTPGVIASGVQGVASGVYASNSYVALYPETAENFSYFKIDEYSLFGEFIGTKLVSKSYEYIFRNSAIITPVFNAESMEGVEMASADAFYFNSRYNGNGVKFESGNSTAESRISIVQDPEDPTNNVLKLAATGTTVASYFSMSLDEIDDNANAVVLEFDLYHNGQDASGEMFMNTEIYLLNSDNASGYNPRASFFQLHKTNLNIYRSQKAGTHKADKTVGSNLVYQGWNHFRIEYRIVIVDGVKTPEWKISVNGVLLATWNNIYGGNYQLPGGSDGLYTGFDPAKLPSPATLNRFAFNVSSGLPAGYMLLDNVCISHYVE